MPDIALITGQSVAVDNDDDTESRILQLEVTEEADVQSAQQVPLSGIDSCPVPNVANAVVVELSDTWSLAIGCDDGQVPSADAGEIILYSMDSVLGTVKSSIALKNDGTIEVSLATGKTLEINSNADAAALASKVDALWTVLWNVTNAFVPPGAPDGGAALATAIAGAISASPAYGATASQSLKVDQ